MYKQTTLLVDNINSLENRIDEQVQNQSQIYGYS